MSNEIKSKNISHEESIKPIPHHSQKEIFDGLHENMKQINYAIQHVVIYNELSDIDSDQICDAISDLKELLIELECDFSF